MKRFFNRGLAGFVSLSLILLPPSAHASELELIRTSMGDLGLYSNKRPKLFSVYLAARPDLRPKAQKWLDPVVESLKSFPVGAMTTKISKNRDNQEVFRFTIKDPSGSIVMDITPSSATQPLKINGIPMPIAAWWNEAEFELFLDNVILDGQIDGANTVKSKMEIFVKLFLLKPAFAGEADELWFEISARACLNITNTADPLCDKPEGTTEVFAKTEAKTVFEKVNEAKKNILTERSGDVSEQKRLDDLIKDRMAKLEKAAKKPPQLPEKKVASMAQPESPVMEAVAVAVAAPAPKPKSIAKKPAAKRAKAMTAKKSKARAKSMKALPSDYDNVDASFEASEADNATFSDLPDEKNLEADTAAKVPAPVVEVSPTADDKSKPFAERRKAMAPQKVSLAIATITGMSLLTKFVSNRAKAPPEKMADATPPEGQIQLLRVPAANLSPDQTLTPVKSRKRKVTN